MVAVVNGFPSGLGTDLGAATKVKKASSHVELTVRLFTQGNQKLLYPSPPYLPVGHISVLQPRQSFGRTLRMIAKGLS